jgi:hypothetical protein
VVTPTHRYVNAGVNPETGSREQWFDADDKPLDEPPPPDTWPELPEAWVLLLTRDYGDGPTTLASEEQAQAWLTGMPDGRIGPLIQEQLNDALAGLNGRCRNPDHGARHDCSQEHVRWIVEFGAAGLPGAKAALTFLRERFVDAVKADRSGGEHQAEVEFDGMVSWAARVCRPDVFYALRALDRSGGQLQLVDDDADELSGTQYRVFKVMEPSEWAASVPDPEFLIAKVLCRDTFGPNAGPKKSLKTHDNVAIGLSVSTGTDLYLSEHFPVRHQGRVLYIVGEGGEAPIRRVLRRVARAYRIDLGEIVRDPSKPLIVSFGAAPIDSPALRGDITRMCEEYGPFALVLIESFYNFHPPEVNAANLFERGQVIDEYHKFIRGVAGEDVTSLLTDHYRSTASAKSLDLDNISMAGQAENADSWITRYHRKRPNVQDGEFWLQTGFGSRQWGGNEWQVDWHLGSFNHDLGHHVGDITWDVRSAVGTDSAESQSDRTVAQILQIIKDQPFELTETQVVKEVGGNRQKAFEAFNGLKANGFIVIERRNRLEGSTTRERQLVGPGPRKLGTDRPRSSE